MAVADFGFFSLGVVFIKGLPWWSRDVLVDSVPVVSDGINSLVLVLGRGSSVLKNSSVRPTLLEGHMEFGELCLGEPSEYLDEDGLGVRFDPWFDMICCLLQLLPNLQAPRFLVNPRCSCNGLSSRTHTIWTYLKTDLMPLVPLALCVPLETLVLLMILLRAAPVGGVVFTRRLIMNTVGTSLIGRPKASNSWWKPAGLMRVIRSLLPL